MKYDWDRKFLEQKYKYDEFKIRKLGEEVEILNKCRVRLREIFILGKEATEVEYYCPIKIERLINKIRAMTRDKGVETVSPFLVYD